jgi:hypothetical protein
MCTLKKKNNPIYIRNIKSNLLHKVSLTQRDPVLFKEVFLSKSSSSFSDRFYEENTTKESTKNITNSIQFHYYIEYVLLNINGSI